MTSPLAHFLPPGFHPQIEDVMQVDISQQGRDYRALWRTHLRLRPFAVLGYSGLQPFLDQPKYSSVGHAMPENLHQPFVVHVVEGNHHTLPTVRTSRNG